MGVSVLTVLVGMLPFTVMQPAAANQSYLHVIGDAFQFGSSELLYREFHCGERDRLSSKVFYQQDDGSLIARKLLDYDSGTTTPSFVQQNYRAGEKVEISFDQQEVFMSMTDATDRELQKRYPIVDIESNPLVIDAGFDMFVRQNWEPLIAGQTREFDFPLASRSSLVSLRIKSSTCSYSSESDQCFVLEPANWLFRMLASPIELGYDAQAVRLTRYRGLSNINDENGDGLIVDIHYRYPVVSETACNTENLPLPDDFKKSS